MTDRKRPEKQRNAKGPRRKTVAGGRRAEDALKESEAKYKLLIEATHTGYVIIDEQGRVQDANQEYIRLSGHDTLEEIAGRAVTEWTAAHDLERNAAQVRKCMECGSVRNLIIDYVGPTGILTPVELNANVLLASGSPRIFTICRDISERKRAEDALRQSERMLQAIIDAEPDCIKVVDRESRIIMMNRAGLSMLQAESFEQVKDQPICLHVTPEYRRAFSDLTRQAFQGGSGTLEFQLVGLRGRQLWLETCAVPLRNGKNEVSAILGVTRDITARKQADEALQRSEAKYRRLYNETPVLLQSIDRNGLVVEVNDYWLQTLGYERDEVIGRKVTDFYTETSRHYSQEVVQPTFFRDGIVRDIPYQFVKKNGDVVEVLLSATAERDAVGTVVRSQAVIVDITLRKRAEDLLRRSETRYRMLYEGTPAMMHSIDAQGLLISVSDQWLSTLGYARDEVLGRRSTDFLDEQSCVYARTVVLPDFMRTGICTDVPYTFVKKNGERIAALLSATAERDEDGKIVRSLAVIIDITERKRAERRLRESEERFKAITMTASDAILLMDDTGSIVYWNPAATRIFGYSAPEVVGRELHLILAPPRLHGNYQKGFAGFVQTGQGPVIDKSVEMLALRKDGTEFPIEVSTSAMNISGRWHALGIVRDITERKLAEASLRRSEERFRDLAESLPLTVFEMDRQGRFTFANKAALEKFGYSQQEFAAGLTLLQILAPGDRERALEVMARRLSADADGYVEYQGLRKDGTTFPITVASSPILRGGRPVGFRGIVADLSERKQLEEERLKAQKLESIGTLAGGIAHDFNNLLQGIFGYISIAKLTIDQREKSLAMLEQSEKALHQSVNLTSQLLTFSKGGKPIKKTVDLPVLIENAVKFALSGSRVGYDFSCDANLCAVEADEGQIGQVVQNIVLNAEQAMPLGGRIEIEARNVPPSRAAGLSLPAPDGLVEIVVRDRGAGIPPAHLPRIFDPYFTTKERGSGLGLATSYAIVKNHDGKIGVSSELGKGSIFTVYLPATGAAREETALSAMSAGCTPRRTGRVLVMDDELMIRTVAGELLQRLGHEVEFAENGAAAVEMFRQARERGRPIDVVILDLTVRGGMGGAEAARRLAEIDPGVKAIVSSGYSDNEVVSTYRQHGFCSCLNKPYNIRELCKVLDDVLG